MNSSPSRHKERLRSDREQQFVGPLAGSGGSKLLDHGQEQFAIAFVQIGRITTNLIQESQLLVRNMLGIELTAERIVGKELCNGKIESTCYLRQCVERGHGVAVFNAGEVTAEQAGLLFNVPL